MNCKEDFKPEAFFISALMREITALLKELTLKGVEGAIDLRGLPLLDQDKKQLEDLLGRGEVFAIINTMGETQIWETAYAGVWWQRHKDTADKIITEQIAITLIPELLKTHEADVKTSLARLQMIFDRDENKEAQHGQDQPEKNRRAKNRPEKTKNRKAS